MSFWDTADEDPLTELLNNPKTSLCDVLQEGTMLQELRTGNAEVINYLTQEKVIGELCEWSMTMTQEKHPEYNKISRTATETMTCGSQFALKLSQSAALKAFFSNYLKTPSEWDPICTGHFQRVFVQILKNTPNGQFLTNFPNIAEELDAHLSILAVAEFIIQLATEFNQYLPKQFVPILAQFIHSNSIDPQSTKDLFPAIYALRQIFNIGFQIKAVSDSFLSEEVISALAASAKCVSNDLSRIELYRLLNKIKEKSPLAAGIIILKHTDDFYHPTNSVKNAVESFSCGEIDSKTAATILANGNAHWGIANKLTSRLAYLPAEEFAEIAKETGLVNTIAENGKNGTLTSQQYEIVRLLLKAKVDLTEVPKQVVDKARIIGVRYGGEVPIGFQAEHKINAE